MEKERREEKSIANRLDERDLLWKRLIDITDSCLSTDGQLSHKSKKMQFKFSSLFFMLKLDFIDNATNDFSPLASQVYEMFCNKLKTMSIAGTEKNVKRKGISIVYNCNYR